MVSLKKKYLLDYIKTLKVYVVVFIRMAIKKPSNRHKLKKDYNF